MTKTTMTITRRRTSTRLRDAELPDCFTTATIAAASRETYRRNKCDARRLDRKVVAILATLAVVALEACGGRVSASPCEEYAARLVAAGCDLPTDLADVVAGREACEQYTAGVTACTADAQCRGDMTTRMIEACHGKTPPAPVVEDYAERYARDACSCADPGPCVESEIVARLREPDVDRECVDQWSEAMETRTSCTDYPAMPTCAIVPPLDAAERYTRAVCACHVASGDTWPGCHDNVIGEVRGANATCLNQLAAGYEVDCSGRSGGSCEL